MRMRKKRGMERARAILAVVVRRFVGVIDGEDIVGRSVGAGVEIGVEKVGVELTVMNEKSLFARYLLLSKYRTFYSQ